MTKITENIHIGSSTDARTCSADFAVLNVAFDLDVDNPLPKERAKVGLIDGPGNTVEAMLAAVYMLSALCRRHPNVLVHCHEGKSRSTSVVALYMAYKGYGTFDRAMACVAEKRTVCAPAPALVQLCEECLKVLK